MKVGFVGLGKLGLPCAAALSVKISDKVYGFDLNPRVATFVETCKIPYQEQLCEDYLSNASLEVLSSVEELVERADLLFFAVQTPHEREYEGVTPVPTSKRDFDYSYLKSAVASVADALRKMPDKQLTLVVISTVLPGTMRQEIFPLLEDVFSRVKFCYNPYFIAMGTTIPDYLDPEFVLLGERMPGDGDELLSLYSRVHAAPVRRMAIESAELTKVAYNTFIGFKIVFANTIAEIVDSRGGNADEVTTALAAADKRLISGKYLSAGMADGGGCHPRDQIAMSWLAETAGLSTNIFEYLAKARDAQTERQAKIVVEYAKKTGLPVTILGLAYKPDVNLTIGSPSLLLGHFLNQKGIDFKTFDPWVDQSGNLPEKANVFFVATNHSLFKNLELPKGSLVIDPWGSATKRQPDVTYVLPGRI